VTCNRQRRANHQGLFLAVVVAVLVVCMVMMVVVRVMMSLAMTVVGLLAGGLGSRRAQQGEAGAHKGKILHFL
jgi:hypothetical protein